MKENNKNNVCNAEWFIVLKLIVFLNATALHLFYSLSQYYKQKSECFLFLLYFLKIEKSGFICQIKSTKICEFYFMEKYPLSVQCTKYGYIFLCKLFFDKSLGSKPNDNTV